MMSERPPVQVDADAEFYRKALAFNNLTLSYIARGAPLEQLLEIWLLLTLLLLDKLLLVWLKLILVLLQHLQVILLPQILRWQQILQMVWLS